MNYFSPASAADRYAKGRPHFHHNTIAHVRSFLHLEQKLENALDVACGTGLSTKALLEIADNVYGTDISEEMLRHAPLQQHIHYRIAPAEQQPFPDQHFDLITVSSGVHWFDITAFLNEVHRLLKPGGWLVLYENHFIAEMQGQPDFTAWFTNTYLRQFPSPPRNNNYDWSNNNLQPKGFRLAFEERFKNPIEFTRDQLVLYFTTQSNVIAAVESGKMDYTTIDNWLNSQLCPYIPGGEKRLVLFGNWIRYIQIQMC